MTQPKVGELAHPQFPPYPNLHYADLAFAASYTRRFHMVRVQREQSLTDHSFRVGVLWRVLFYRWKASIRAAIDNGGKYDEGFDGIAAVNLDKEQLELLGLRLCMDHDLAEVLCGDVPSHSKSPAVKEGMDEIEDHILHMVVDHETFLGHLTSPIVKSTQEWRVAKALLKLADITEGLIFSHYNQGRGAEHPDGKSRWVNDNWNRMAPRYIQSMDPTYFTTRFKTDVEDWIVVQHCGITPQHA